METQNKWRERAPSKRSHSVKLVTSLLLCLTLYSCVQERKWIPVFLGSDNIPWTEQIDDTATVAFSIKVKNRDLENMIKILSKMGGPQSEIYLQIDYDRKNYTDIHLVFPSKNIRQRAKEAIYQYNNMYINNKIFFPNFINPRETLLLWPRKWHFYEQKNLDPDDYI